MALNFKDKETEALVAKLASLTGETETEVVRTAARERLERLEGRSRRGKQSPEEIRAWLETEVWPQIPKELLGKSISKAEREEILGLGPDGV